MYFKLYTTKNDDKFSWIICKDPNNLEGYTRSPKNNNIKITGRFCKSPNEYEILVEPNTVEIIKVIKEKNLPVYVNVEQGAVTVLGLDAISDVLRSAINGNNSSGGFLTDDEVASKKSLECIIGPYFSKSDTVIETFKEVDIIAEPIEHKGINYVNMFKLSPTSDITISQFLQKIYIISFYLSRKSNLYLLGSEKIVKFVKFSKDWLNDYPNLKSKVITGITRNHVKYKKMFEDGLMFVDSTELEDTKKTLDIETEKDITLQSKRRNLILETIKESTTDTCSIIDLGCGDGKILKEFIEKNPDKKLKLLGLDANGFRIRKASQKLHTSKIKFKQTNILMPNITDRDVNPDYLICSEVIEHFNYNDRDKLMSIIIDLIQPKEFIITTPNKSYNINYGLTETEFRHPDHKIEFDEETFHSEIMKRFSTKYILNLLQLNGYGEIEPTFCLHGIRKEDIKTIVNKKKLKQLEFLHAPLLLPCTNGRVSSSNISSGLSSNAVIENLDNIFYLGPTIAPVEYNEKYSDHLEHPMSGIDYFNERGVKELILETKYMGSRSYILAFQNEEISKCMGFDKPIVINSRSGYRFFKNDTNYEDIIYNEIKSVLQKDEFIILDCEITPWAYLSGNGMIRDYYIPGECIYLSRKYCNSSNQQESQLFLNVLNHFAKTDDIKVHPFNILTQGTISNNRYVIKTHGYVEDQYSQLKRIESLFKNSEFIEPCRYKKVSTVDKFVELEVIKFWEENKNSEGIVIKPNNLLSFSSDDYPIQQALKARHKSYLHLVYGCDYLDDKVFKIVTKRNIKSKRILAAQEAELSRLILNSFLRNKKEDLTKSIGSFIGMDSITSSSIDSTL